jgi:hypothetical protein
MNRSLYSFPWYFFELGEMISKNVTALFSCANDTVYP